MNELNIIEVLNTINGARLQNKNKWYSGKINVDNKYHINYKGDNTWLQVFEINGVNYSSGMDIKVKDFKSHTVTTLREV